MQDGGADCGIVDLSLPDASGLEALTISPDKRFVNVGERCNIAGSLAFKKLILAGDYDKALAIARKDKEVISLSADEQKRWSAAFKALTAAQVSAIEKTGAPARAFAKAYGLNV